MEESERLSSILIFYNLWTLLTSVVLLKTVPGIIHLESKSKTIYCIHNLYLVESLGFLTQIQLRLNHSGLGCQGHIMYQCVLVHVPVYSFISV